MAARHPDWVVGYVDEVWWSRLAQPALHAWGETLRLHAKARAKDDPQPKALACYGLLRTDPDRVLLRFVEGRPVSRVTTDFLAWGADRIAAEGKRVWVLVWDNAAWHVSRAVQAWIGAHNRTVKRTGGVRILVCRLPVKSPWLNPIEPRWLHGKRAVVEPDPAARGAGALGAGGADRGGRRRPAAGRRSRWRAALPQPRAPGREATGAGACRPVVSVMGRWPGVPLSMGNRVVALAFCRATSPPPLRRGGGGPSREDP